MRIRQARKLAGLTARQLAEKIERSPTTVFRWEWGVRLPTRQGIEACAEALHVPMAWLMFGLRGLPRDLREQCERLERAGRAL